MKKPAQSRQVVVKKVSPYPFVSQLIFTNPQPISGKVMKLTNDGALVDIGSVLLKVGVTGGINFTLPTYQTELQIQCKVLKVHDRAQTTTKTTSPETILAQKTKNPAASPNSDHAVGGKPKVLITRIIEVRFLLLSDAAKNEISQFLSKIKQA